jgi:D-3-phosphoglycerate dehydrogenase
MTAFKVYVVETSYDDYAIEKRIVEEAGGTLECARCKNEEDIIEQCSDAHGLLLRQTPVGERTFRALRNLRVVSRYGVGYDNVDVAAATQASVAVTIVPDYCVAEVADHTIALFMAAVRHISARDRLVRKGGWDLTRRFPTHRTDNRIYGLVGYGKTAREVRRRLSGFPLRFVACDPVVHDEVFLHEGTLRLDFKRLVIVSHYISVHVPLTSGTRHLFDPYTFRAMRKSAVLINTSRGPIVDNASLVHALQERWIAGAALDVYEEEPPGRSNPLRNLDNVILSDHAAWYSEESQRELQYRTAMEAVRVIRGERPEHTVTPGMGWRERTSTGYEGARKNRIISPQEVYSCDSPTLWTGLVPRAGTLTHPTRRPRSAAAVRDHRPPHRNVSSSRDVR